MSQGGRPNRASYDVVVIGAGFYGCALADWMARDGNSVLICEMGKLPMERASAVNQARVHNGFHYPRSLRTAIRSNQNFERFCDEFSGAIHRDFKMLYAIARYGTKVDARRFYGMFEAMNAPIERAGSAYRELFSSDLVEEVFVCREYAFDWIELRRIMMSRLANRRVELALSTTVSRVYQSGGSLAVELATGVKIGAGRVFNVAYSQVNKLLQASGISALPLKHELVEIAIVDPPPQMEGVAVTLMDGPFFSLMPYPSVGAYSLTHVRYTPHFSWTDEISGQGAYETSDMLPRLSRWKHMLNDSKRYLGVLENTRFRHSLYDVKTVLIRSESDDGRPILLQGHPELPGLSSVLGSKVDNIFDLYDALGPNLNRLT